MRICSVEPEVQVRPLWQKYLQKRSTVNTQWMGILVANVRPVGQLPQEHR